MVLHIGLAEGHTCQEMAVKLGRSFRSVRKRAWQLHASAPLPVSTSAICKDTLLDRQQLRAMADRLHIRKGRSLKRGLTQQEAARMREAAVEMYPFANREGELP